MRVLAIGNSFSQDATRYLHQIARSAGEDMKVVNLYIGGCSLRTHYLNTLENEKKYLLEFNGESTGFFVSMKDALISDEWDAVTLQQVSGQSPHYDSYQPYLDGLVEHVDKYAPKAKLYLHQTWAYEDGSQMLADAGFSTHQEMLEAVKAAYSMAEEDVYADGIIPSGEVMCRLLRNGIERVHRDTFHATLGIGRYALGLTWYGALTGKSIDDTNLLELDEAVLPADMLIARGTVKEVMEERRG